MFISLNGYFVANSVKQPIIDHALSKDYISTWKAMELLVAAGKTRAIGVSNFSILKTKRLLEAANIRPAVNQIELHPYTSYWRQ